MTDDIDAVKVGDAVKVFDVNGRRMGQPADGWDGEVIKVGRVLTTIKYHGRPTVFRLDTRQTNDNYCHQHYETLARAELNNRRRIAREVMRVYGLEIAFNHNNSLPLFELEAIAELIKSFERIDHNVS